MPLNESVGVPDPYLWGIITGAIPTIESMTISQQIGSGAITFDASKGSLLAVTMNGNVTSSSVTNAQLGQVIVLAFVQDGTGGRTYAWPANAKFAGNAAPAAGATTAGFRDQVTFYFDGVNLRELARATGVGA